MVFVTLLILLSNNRQVSASEQNLLEINRTDLEVGEVILLGNQNKDGDCEIDPFKIQTTAISASENKSWLGILLDASKCQVIVNAKWRVGPDLTGYGLVTQGLRKSVTSQMPGYALRDDHPQGGRATREGSGAGKCAAKAAD